MSSGCIRPLPRYSRCNPSACDFAQQQVCVYVRLRASNTPTVHYCALINILLEISFGGGPFKMVSSIKSGFNLYLPIKVFKAFPRVHRKTPACKLVLIRAGHIFTCAYLSLARLCRHWEVTLCILQTPNSAGTNHTRKIQDEVCVVQ